MWSEPLCWLPGFSWISDLFATWDSLRNSWARASRSVINDLLHSSIPLQRADTARSSWRFILHRDGFTSKPSASVDCFKHLAHIYVNLIGIDKIVIWSSRIRIKMLRLVSSGIPFQEAFDLHFYSSLDQILRYFSPRPLG